MSVALVYLWDAAQNLRLYHYFAWGIDPVPVLHHRRGERRFSDKSKGTQKAPKAVNTSAPNEAFLYKS